ncbi:MAG: succinylglutamate desuccinylase/aspartoacylase family protein [Candidatus Magnetomorum sp.]|nr:succinylglutamate desuccinylase/aspartoacylase family protein [Candidatus Magnetomorum sp.]
MKNTLKKRIYTLFTHCLLCPLLVVMCHSWVWAVNQHSLVYFEGTNHELHVFKIHGKKPGKTLLIIGGIQGDEPGGFLSADQYVDMSLSQGNLIVVPRANFYSILLGKRDVNVDMNRKFSGDGKKTYEAKVVEILKQLINESDLLLNLHDGSGFFSEKWENNNRNPMRYGQSIIADCDVYINPNTGDKLELGNIARQVSVDINRYISDERHHFHFNNHRTNSKDTHHKEQRKSATYYSLYRRGIPAFGVESSKSLPLALKVFHHNLAINAFMKYLDIIPETPSVRIDPPKLKHLVISVNNDMPVVVEDGQTLYVDKGDAVTITHVESNYDRGIVADVVGYGTVNDVRKRIIINRQTEVNVRKDHYSCGTVHIALGRQQRTRITTQKDQTTRSDLLFFWVKVNGVSGYYNNYERIPVIKGDTIELVDIISGMYGSNNMIFNFKGFVPNPKSNSGEDRGFVIRTDCDLQTKFSLNRDGRIYHAVATANGHQIGELFFELIDPLLSYVVFKVNEKEKRCISPGETIFAHENAFVELIDCKTNIHKNKGVQVFINGENTPKLLVRPYIAIDWNVLTQYSSLTRQRYRLDIERESLLLGTIYIEIDPLKVETSTISVIESPQETIYQ